MEKTVVSLAEQWKCASYIMERIQENDGTATKIERDMLLNVLQGMYGIVLALPTAERATCSLAEVTQALRPTTPPAPMGEPLPARTNVAQLDALVCATAAAYAAAHTTLQETEQPAAMPAQPEAATPQPEFAHVEEEEKPTFHQPSMEEVEGGKNEELFAETTHPQEATVQPVPIAPQPTQAQSIQAPQPIQAETTPAPQPIQTQPIQAPQPAPAQPAPAPQPTQAQPIQAPQPIQAETTPATQPIQTQPTQAPQPIQAQPAPAPQPIQAQAAPAAVPISRAPEKTGPQPAAKKAEPSLFDLLNQSRAAEKTVPTASKTNPTIGETIVHPAHNVEEDLEDRVKKHKVDDLRAIININDKFSFMSELFHGNMKAYNDFILHLNATADRAAALSYVGNTAQQYHWDNESLAVKTFYSLLDRKF